MKKGKPRGKCGECGRDNVVNLRTKLPGFHYAACGRPCKAGMRRTTRIEKGDAPLGFHEKDCRACEETTPAWAEEEVAQAFHEAYERLAPSHGYETRKDSAVPWADVPEKNKRLMIAVCREVMLPLLVKAEARGRNQAAQSEQYRTGINTAFEEGRAEGERIGREKGLAGVDALLEACDDFTAHLFNTHNLLVTESFAEAIEQTRAVQSGAKGEK